MSKKQADRRPDQKPADQGSDSRYDPSKPEYGRKMPEVPEDKGRPEGGPIDKPFPKPETRGGDKDFLEGERSDRQSGRPIQLEEDDPKTLPGQRSGRADSKPGQVGRPQEGSEGRKPLEGEPTKR
jgi:hypothetical protein